MGEVGQPPFSLRFSTDSYDLGEHTFSALGYTSSGRKCASNSLNAVFVSAKEGWEAGLKILVPILSLVFGVMVIMIVATVFSSGLGAKKLQGIAVGRRAQVWHRRWGDLPALPAPVCAPFSFAQSAGGQAGALPVLRQSERGAARSIASCGRLKRPSWRLPALPRSTEPARRSDWKKIWTIHDTRIYEKATLPLVYAWFYWLWRAITPTGPRLTPRLHERPPEARPRPRRACQPEHPRPSRPRKTSRPHPLSGA